MLFRKKMERSCAYCSRAVKIDEDTMVCVKRGVVCPEDACRRFRYDPLKRIPFRQPRLQKYKPEDFVL